MVHSWYSGNQVDLLETGSEFFPALLHAIEHATQEIHLETYIFRIDSASQPIAMALAAAAQRGVRCYVLVDGFGSRDFPEQWQQRFQATGVEFLFFRPERLRWLPRRNRLRRLHRKLAMIDGTIAFVGGINLHHDLDDAEPHFLPRYDYAVRLRGPIVLPIYQTIKKMWRRERWLRGSIAPVPRLIPTQQPAGELNVRFLTRDNVRHRQSIEIEYLKEIHSARREIIIANAYFLPGFRFRHAIKHAAQRGVKVKILLQGRVDHAIFYYATRVLFRDFLREGVEIYEYRAGFLHAKVAIVDGLWATVGSSNIDPFSLMLAQEANVVVKNHLFADHLRDRVVTRIEQYSRPVHLLRLRHAHWLERSLMWCCYAFVRAAVGIAGLGQRYFRG
ncbi:MAG: cardiolipin synthase ClsB [Aquaspirillum sp.]|nr:cardiolipin synthase ClsB [Aquaspirillum sp.]